MFLLLILLTFNIDHNMVHFYIMNLQNNETFDWTHGNQLLFKTSIV